ncbi:helix-turn-helix domain-containing protein [Methylobacterium marchantiae]|uniref:Helix-turn-helix domain-containing protein n=1 Tax=Methylobacterium marchantiae TaxID=600331 RepID=A0ABW3X0A0_9HYPH|nr:UvrABC system protein C [Methylobacterium marchantiae]
MANSSAKISRFGKWLKKIREDNELTAQAVAEQAGVSSATIRYIEVGRTQNPSADTQSSIEEAIEYLISGGVSKFGQWLKSEREKSGLSASQLSQKVGISPQSIYNIENGKTLNPSYSTKEKIESVLGVEAPENTTKEDEASQSVEGLGSLQDFDPHAFDLIPSEPGVYVLYDISDRPIYVGRSKNVRKRLIQHSNAFWYKKPIVVAASYIKITQDELRNQIEEIMIKFLKTNAVINKSYVDRNMEEK